MLRADVLRFSAMACLLLAAQGNSYMLSTPAGVQLQRHAAAQPVAHLRRRQQRQEEERLSVWLVLRVRRLMVQGLMVRGLMV